MRERLFRFLLLLLAGYLLVSGCAKMNTPAGGPKDREAPEIIKSLPPSGTINFKGSEVVITFNEYVVLDKINEKFMVSPPMKRKPQVFTRGKSVHIKLFDKLRDSTTYTFNFQDAIRDLNEGNPISNYQFVFSTGPSIDSLSVTGNVLTGLTLNPPENTIVLLYGNLADSAVIKLLPDYITRVLDNGEFRIDNVRAGTYRLYALTDADNSKTYNNKSEEFAFYPDTIRITPSKNYLPMKKDTAKIVQLPEKALAAAKVKEPEKPPVEGEYQLIMFLAEKTNHYLTSSSRKLPYQLTYTLSLPPDTMKFDFSIPEAPPKSYFIEQNRERDTITVWLTDSTLYNRQQLQTIVSFPYTDSLGITKLRTDSISMRYITPKAPRGRVSKRVAYKAAADITAQVRPDKQIMIIAPTPFLKTDTSRIKFYELIKDTRIRHPYTLVKDTLNSRKYFMDTKLDPGKSYLFITESSAFTDIYGQYSDSTGIRFTVQTPQVFGKVTFDISGYEGAMIIQMLDNTEKLIRELKMNAVGKAVFPLLDKGTYRARTIFDINKDGKWTPGDFDKHRQPEPVSYYPDELKVPENWDITQPWELVKGNFKNPKLLIIKKVTR